MIALAALFEWWGPDWIDHHLYTNPIHKWVYVFDLMQENEWKN
jgi:hypothetical protein